MIETLFEKQRISLEYFFKRIDREKTDQILKVLLACKGIIIFSGVGKSGIIAQKLANTMLSTGTRALFLPPTDALHGDIGIVSQDDVFILMSKSGESEELLGLIPYLRKKGSKLIALVSNPDSRLAQKSDFFVTLPMQQELCPFDLAPTTSTAVQLLYGDVLAIALMQAKKFSLSDFALNHPGGSLGKKLTLQVKDVMFSKEKIPLCRENQTVIEVLHELSSKRCGCILIVDENKKLKGIFTDGDLRRGIQSESEGLFCKPIAHFMSEHPKFIHEDSLAIDALKEMEKDPQKLITVLPVLRDSQVVGILRMHDILQAGLRQ